MKGRTSASLVGAAAMLAASIATADVKLTNGWLRPAYAGQPAAMVYVDTAQDGFANVYVSPFSEQLTGCTPAEWRNDPKMFQKVLHPDDRDMLALDESSEGVEHEYRLITKRFRGETRGLRADRRPRGTWLAQASAT